MKNKFGVLKGIDVYKVREFDEELQKQGYIQLVPLDRRYSSVYTTRNEGTYDHHTGELSLYDDFEFEENIKMLKTLARRYELYTKEPVSLKSEVKATFEFEEDADIKDIKDIIEDIMSKAKNTCEELLELTEAVG